MVNNMGARKTKQDRAIDGKYEKFARCDKCGISLGNLDLNGDWLPYNGDCVCLECAKKLNII